ncbi:uncharacterized protein cubi_01790 [Cryptosporidium ubiquitum]|uniref:Uncharacterized protein n=1 Tax=Cryptosporidium ubiquitum TaxID=857276 RepID=A0A1J4MCV2_9CRYT|nr:uncharacterized protein cubi_01790 [Cryptosporidium ubiquitum]OII71315.1 hypothetical protein cubi_01790 [Cryptosporidium ubiquitum]
MMDINILKNLDIDELIVIEARLKNSILDLNKLINELYKENCRILRHNLELNNLKNRFPNTKERIGNLLKSAFFSQFNNSEKSESIKFGCSSTTNGEYISKHGIDHGKLFSNCEEKKNYTIEKPNINYHLMPTKEAKCNQHVSYIEKIPDSIFNGNLDSNKYDLKPKPISQKLGDRVTSIEYGNMAEHTINLLIDEENYVKIRFSKFENDQSREGFVKEIIEIVGLKPIYFDCMKNLLKNIEIKNDCIENLIDIANLDPWENYHEISLKS